MEIDFETVKALSSPTRVRILNKVLNGEETPTSLSDQLEKSKSTVSSHLSTLQNAELIEKDAEEGRKRVIYQPTRKARNIVKGREKKVKFALSSSAVSVLAGVSIGFYGLKEMFMLGMTKTAESGSYKAGSEQAAGAMNALEVNQTAQETTGDVVNSGLIESSAELLLIVSVGFLAFSAVSFFYGYTMRKLG